MGSIAHHLRNQAGDLRSRIGIQIVLVHALIIAVFGVLFPWMRATIFLEPVVTAAYCCLGVLFAGPAVAQGFGVERPRSLNNAVARILWAVAYGELIAALILLTGFTTVFVTHRYAFAPDVATLFAAGTLGITASFAMAAVAAWISLRFSAAGARRAMRILFLMLLFLFFFRSTSLPDLAGEASLISLAIAAAALYALRRAIAR